MAKNETYNRLINTVRWRKLRHQVITDHPLCVRCLREDRVRPATEVHHIRPVEEATGEAAMSRLMFDPSNLQALCHSCHVESHKELGRSGRKANKERKKRQAREGIKRFYD